MSSRGGTAEDPSAVHLPHESSLDRKSADSAMRLVIQPTSLQQSARAMNPDQASMQNTLKTGLLVSRMASDYCFSALFVLCLMFVCKLWKSSS